MDDYSRHVRFFNFMKPICTLYVKRKFNYKYESLNHIDGPFLLLSNHNTDYDPLMLGAASDRHMYFVATEKITRMGFLSKIVMYYLSPIIHYKGRIGISTVRDILKNLKNGVSIALFPEGNRSFNGVTCDFIPTIGKLAKRSGASLVTYRLHGGYLSSPRWGKGTRRGRIRGEIAHIYSPDELKNMTEDEINSAIKTDLYVDAYADQALAPIEYAGKKIALGIESTLFRCPECGGISTMKSAENTVACPCGCTLTYDHYGYLTDTHGKKFTVTDLDTLQRKAIEELSSTASDQLLFSDSVTLQHIGAAHEVTSEENITLCAYADRLEAGSLVLPFHEISGMAINQRNLLIVHYGEDGHIEMTADLSFSALKYLYLFKATGNPNEEI